MFYLGNKEILAQDQHTEAAVQRGQYCMSSWQPDLAFCKSAHTMLTLKAQRMKDCGNHAEWVRPGAMWQGQKVPEERPEETIGEGASSVLVENTGDARTVGWLSRTIAEQPQSCKLWTCHGWQR